MRSDCCTFLPRLRDTFDAVNVACDSDHKAAGLQVPDRCNVACATAYLPVFVGCQDIIARMDVDAFAALANACRAAMANVGGPDAGGEVDVGGLDDGVHNLVLDLPTGGCAMDPCVADGSCAVETAHGPDGSSNGVRRCGAASSSTVGWGGEPDRAIDNSRSGAFGDASCTHTDAQPAWWQVDLGAPAQIHRIAVWHRTDCCQNRLEGAAVIVSSSPDFATGSQCSPLSDHTQEPEISACQELVGQFVTVSHADSSVVTICEAEVWGSFVPGGEPWVGGWEPPPTDSAPTTREIKLTEDLPSGDCAFDPCVDDGSCAVTTDNMCGGGCAGTNGVRRCGAASSSTVGWGGEPDRALDGISNGAWGAGSCTHTDGAGSYDVPGTHWWQVDLGATAVVDRVSVWHRTNCCQDRLESANIVVSAGTDYSLGTICGALSDHNNIPETTDCGQASGQYVTVSVVGRVVTLCEFEAWGHWSTGLVRPPPPGQGPRYSNLVLGLPSGDCAFDPCVDDGSCAVTTDNMCGGGCAGTNGVRRCGAASSSTIGWGGEPDRAIDNAQSGNWGDGSCTHTDSAPAWWQVDLGATAHIDHVSVFHRTDCCQDRLQGASVYVSSTSDFEATGRVCAPLSDFSQVPEEARCMKMIGRFVTISNAESRVVTICEAEVWGEMIDDEASHGGGH